MREDEKDTLLTGRQIEVLKLKRKGLSQADIARKLKTTRGNISTIENTALKNIEKAEKTLKLYRALEAPVWMTVPSGTDLYEIPQMIFKEAGPEEDQDPHRLRDGDRPAEGRCPGPHIPPRHLRRHQRLRGRERQRNDLLTPHEKMPGFGS